ncbi:MAG: biotin/lipoyl-containing protein, partial [Pseudomonadota bacterium]
MPTEILMPALSPTMEEGTLAKWLVKEGDEVASGDLLAEIETDKATMEFEAVDEGVIGKILVAEGTEGVKVNVPIAVLLDDGESAGDIAAAPANGAASTSEPAPQAASPDAGASAPGPAAAAPAPAAPASADGKRVFASPLARRIAADKGLDLSAIKGSGPHGRIVKADVEGASAAPAAAPSAAPAAAAPSAAPAPSTAAAAMPTGPSAEQVLKMYTGRDYEEVALNGMRKTVASRLTEAKQTIPHFYLRRDIELDALLKFRSQLNKQLEGRGV